MSRKDDLLFELYTEEIPASYQALAIRAWEKKLPDLFSKNKLHYEKLHVGGTSRRIYFLVEKIDDAQELVKEEIKGPPKKICFDNNEKPTKALEGFLKKNKLHINDIKFKPIKNVDYVFAEVETGGAKLQDILPDLLIDLIFTVKFPRVMKWGNNDILYPRPILSYYIMYGKEILSFEKNEHLFFQTIQTLTGIKGHFILNKDLILLKEPAEYFHKLKDKNIIVEPKARKEYILQELHTSAEKKSLSLVESQSLLNEVNFLVEKPSVVIGEFPKEFLALPDIVIISEMEEHQKYFAMRDKNKQLSNYFLIVSNANVGNSENYQNVKAGNERVLKARISDGDFFFKEDRKIKLIEKVEALKNVVFHENFGSLFEKKERLKTIAQYFNVEKLSQEIIDRACDLIKADLTTQLVFEFEHLQGEIGSIYARLDQEDEQISASILEHYLPRNQDDDYPQTSLGIMLSLSEKIDNIIAGFILDKQPTSSQDPLGLRRQALYFIEIIIQNKMNIDMANVLKQIIEIYSDRLAFFKKEKSQIIEKIWGFFKVRLITIFEKKGFDKLLIRAGIQSGSHDIFDLHKKMTALQNFQSDESFNDMITSFKRMNNIVDKNKNEIAEKINEKILKVDEEKKLYEMSIEFSKIVKKENDYEKVFLFLAKQKSIIDNFFDKVMVISEDIKERQNRLAILFSIVSSMKKYLDLGELS